MQHRYLYEGPVMEFNRIIANRWSSSTIASSEKKARCNLKCQFKKQFGKAIDSKIDLPGDIKLLY